MDDLSSILSIDYFLENHSRDLVSLSLLLRWPLLCFALCAFVVCSCAAEYSSGRVSRLLWILRAERSFQVAGCLSFGPPFLFIGYAIRALRRDQFARAFYFLFLAIVLSEQEKLFLVGERLQQLFFPAPVSWLSWAWHLL